MVLENEPGPVTCNVLSLQPSLWHFPMIICNLGMNFAFSEFYKITKDFSALT